MKNAGNKQHFIKTGGHIIDEITGRHASVHSTQPSIVEILPAGLKFLVGNTCPLLLPTAHI
jgi:hypothetical protein